MTKPKQKRGIARYFSLFIISFSLLMASPLSGDFLRDDVKEIVLDISTNLMWQDDNRAKTDSKNWENTITFCENLDLGGYSDWHLPNFNELYGLADRSKDNPAISEVFQNVVSSGYWSSTTNASNTSCAWYVRFRNGNDSNDDKTRTLYVRCVRLADND